MKKFLIAVLTLLCAGSMAFVTACDMVSSTSEPEQSGVGEEFSQSSQNDLTSSTGNVNSTGNSSSSMYFPTPPLPTLYEVAFDSDGGSVVDSQQVESGLTAVEPDAPEKDGFTFLYWTLDGEEYDFSTPITGNITLVAAWEAV